MRPLSACIPCRERRKRCERPQQGTSCTFCSAKKIECVMTPKADAQLPRSYELLRHHRDGPDWNPSSLATLDQDLIEQLATLYFENLQPAFPYLFHEPTFMAQITDGSIPLILIHGVIGLSARFSPHPSLENLHPWERGKPYAREAERLLNLHDVSLTTCQACVLLALNFVAEGESHTESVYFAIAARMALLLDLPNAPAKTAIEQELNRRVWWTIVTTDTWSSSSLSLPRAVNPGDDIPLPVDEWTFAKMSPDMLKIPNEAELDPSLSVLGHLVKLNKLLYEISQLNSMIADDRLQSNAAESQIESLSTSLQQWLANLPREMHYTESNMTHWTEQGFGQIFTTIHINYNHAAQLLFYQFLYSSQTATDRSSLTTAMIYANRCKQHAANLCELIYNAREQHGLNMRHALLGHVLVIASTVQIHNLLFSLDEDEISRTKIRLERNFETLTGLYAYWPNIAASFSRLRAFHRACLKSTRSSFRLDRWMLRFMLEFSRPVDERDEEIDDSAEDGDTFDQLRYLVNP